ncbi:MAG: hypothetical protein Q9212_006536 [Teloschistes hypoglaucus]
MILPSSAYCARGSYRKSISYHPGRNIAVSRKDARPPKRLPTKLVLFDKKETKEAQRRNCAILKKIDESIITPDRVDGRDGQRTWTGNNAVVGLQSEIRAGA